MPRVIRINHIGLAVAGINDALRVFSDGLGLVSTGSEDVVSESVHVEFLTVGESTVELLEPLGGEGPVQKFIASRGPGMHHLCLEVEDLPGMIAQLDRAGVMMINEEPRPGAHGTRVAFIHPKAANGVLIELVESSSITSRQQAE